MRLVSLSQVFLLVLSTSCIASAGLTAAQAQSQARSADWYQPGFGHGGYDDCADDDGCWLDPGSGGGYPYDPGPYDPQPGYPGPGNPGYPGYPGGPGHGYPPPAPLPPPGYPPHEPPPYPGNPGYGRQQINLNIYRTVYGNDRIDLTTYFNLSRYRGWAIEQVIINGRTVGYGSAALNLIINGNNYGQAVFNSGSSQKTIRASRRPVIGMGADSIVLYTSGQMNVDRVSLVISR